MDVTTVTITVPTQYLPSLMKVVTDLTTKGVTNYLAKSSNNVDYNHLPSSSDEKPIKKPRQILNKIQKEVETLVRLSKMTTDDNNRLKLMNSAESLIESVVSDPGPALSRGNRFKPVGRPLGTDIKPTVIEANHIKKSRDVCKDKILISRAARANDEILRYKENGESINNNIIGSNQITWRTNSTSYKDQTHDNVKTGRQQPTTRFNIHGEPHPDDPKSKILPSAITNMFTLLQRNQHPRADYKTLDDWVRYRQKL